MELDTTTSRSLRYVFGPPVWCWRLLSKHRQKGNHMNQADRQEPTSDRGQGPVPSAAGFNPQPDDAGTRTITARFTEAEYARLAKIAEARKMTLPKLAKKAILHATGSMAS